jgi:tetratricopeptide (TPR) repeat protein
MHAEPLRGCSFDALMSEAGEAFGAGDDAAVAESLAKAGAVLPEPLPDEIAWRARAMNYHRAQAGFAQKQGRHADAVTAFEAAIAVLPAEGTGDRDALAARLQLLVRMARSRLSLGQAKEVGADMLRAEAIIETLSGLIPSRALDTIRVAVLGNSGAALALLGKPADAETRFSESLALIDSLGGPDLAGLRKQILENRAATLKRAAGHDTVPSKTAADGHAHAACGCGHDHAHGNDHHAHGDHHHPEGCARAH